MPWRGWLNATAAQGTYPAAINFARRWLSLDRLNEAAHCQLMRIYARAGQRSGFSASFKNACRCSRMSWRFPQPSTTALYKSILQGSLPQPSDLSSKPNPRGPLRQEEMSTSSSPQRGQGANLPGEEGSRLSPVKASWPGCSAGPSWHSRAWTGCVYHRRCRPRENALIQEFARRAQQRWSDLIVAGGNCNAYTGEGDPYLPFREILGLLTGDIDALWAAGAISREHAHRLWDAFPLVISALVEAGPDLLNTFLPLHPSCGAPSPTRQGTQRPGKMAEPAAGAGGPEERCQSRS